jgi:hypothetical protein
MILFLLFLTITARADFPRRWENAKGLVERHEFYADGEMLTKPADTWQTLFALTFLDGSFHLSKDCVFFRVPGDEPGILKMKIVPANESCVNQILSHGDQEIKNISDLKMKTSGGSVELEFHSDGKKNTWKFSLLKDWKRPEVKPLLSSADFKSPGVIYLSQENSGAAMLKGINDGEICHDISNDCSEKAPSVCSECEHGWQEIPNGCAIGPKICGPLTCGRKNQPACRRGYVWQRKEHRSDCRINSDFAWCSKGLSVFCDGDRAWCR